MILRDEPTWPIEVVRHLEHNSGTFWKWEQRCRDDQLQPIHVARAIAAEYDQAVVELRAVLSNHDLHGYHCTRLTESEINDISINGMQLPNRAMLQKRIQTLQRAGLIEAQVAERLAEENQADDDNRAGVLCFCFYPPYLAGQLGIERMFRSWGGEALYNSHERNPLTGPILRGIGTPCIIEADVPIASFPQYTFLETKVARQFLANRGIETRECLDHEDRTTQPLPARNIRRIIRMEEPDFIPLTQCDTWMPPLK